MLSAQNRQNSGADWFYWRQYGYEYDKKSRNLAFACLTGLVFVSVLWCAYFPERRIALQTGRPETVMIMRKFVQVSVQEKPNLRKILADKSAYEIPKEAFPRKIIPEKQKKSPVVPERRPEQVKQKPQSRQKVTKQAVQPVSVPQKSLVRQADSTQALSPLAVGSSEAAKVSESAVLANILREIEKHKRYPRKARRKGVEGTSSLIIRLDSRGIVTDIALAQSSGAGILDNASIELGRKLLGFDSGSGRALSVQVPIIFSLRDK